MKFCDVLVVGGGPAGSACARELRRAGLDVVVMDKKQFPRKKVCAGWVTPAVMESLEVDCDDYASGRVLQPITGFRVGVIGRKQVLLNYRRVVSYGILRGEFDEYLLRRCGAELRLGEEFSTIEKSGGGFRVNDSLETNLIIGAGGHFCPVARYLGATQGREIAVAAQELEFEMTPAQERQCEVRGDVPELFVSHDLLGYAWCFRKGSYLNIGLGSEDGKAVSGQAQEFLRLLKSMGRIPQDTPTKFRGHAYILYGRTQRQLLADGMILIGDAAGLAYLESGEGIRTAVESGLLAAETIRSLQGDFSRAKLEPYAKRLTSRFGKPKVYKPPTGLNASIQRALIGSKWFARHVLMDRMILHRHQAALLAD